MSLLPDPSWPVLVLAAVSAVDGALCLRPARFVAECFVRVGWPHRYWPVMPPLKFAAAAGLAAGLWIPALGLVTVGCLVAYFLIAIAMHLRARDLGRNLFVNATGMFAGCVATLLYSFVF